VDAPIRANNVTAQTEILMARVVQKAPLSNKTANTKPTKRNRKTQMKSRIELATQDLTGAILPCQYNDLIRRRVSAPQGEFRLLWAVLEDAIRTYVANRRCSNASRRKKFEEVSNWFEPAQAESRTIFDYQNVCDLLGIDSGRLLKSLKSLDARSLSVKRYRLLPSTRSQRLAA
jgi:hypothetical protein